MLPTLCFHALLILMQLTTSLSSTQTQELQYDFKENLKLTVWHHAGGIYCLGTIGKDGAFLPDLADLEKAIQAAKTGVGRLGSWPQPLASPRSPNELVYELRSGALIPMIFDLKHGLIPEVGGKIIAFQDYRYSPISRRIYNLPGAFVIKQAVTK